uniref:Guanylate cyclase activator 2B n=1 Tax=Amazona collaria TaxID=241587 RepID=A0A8B9J097_9PSIT
SVLFMLPVICVPLIMWTSFKLKTLFQHCLFPIDGDLKFSLESVKKLKELMDENRHINPRFVVSMASYSPCDEKDLPEEFQSVCKREDASVIFERLSMYLILRSCHFCLYFNLKCSGSSRERNVILAVSVLKQTIESLLPLCPSFN